MGAYFAHFCLAPRNSFICEWAEPYELCMVGAVGGPTRPFEALTLPPFDILRGYIPGRVQMNSWCIPVRILSIKSVRPGSCVKGLYEQHGFVEDTPSKSRSVNLWTVFSPPVGLWGC